MTGLFTTLYATGLIELLHSTFTGINDFFHGHKSYASVYSLDRIVWPYI